MLAKIIARASQTNPSHGDWCVNGHDVTMWVNASSLATYVVIENGGSLAEDASWLQLVHKYRHINLVQQWKASVLHLED